MNNRYYSNAYGRFMTPDPSTSSQDPRIPQSWNRYSYVIGDPVNGTDPSGLDTEETCDGGDGSDDDSGDCGAGGVMANSSTANYSDSDVSGTYCTDSSGSSVSCDSPGAVLTATGPGNDGGTSTIASGASGVLDTIASLFGYNSQIPLPSCFGLFLTNTADNLNPFTPSPSTVAEGATEVAGRMTFNHALIYAATRSSKTFGTSFLIYPFKSSVFRGLLTRAGFLAEAAPIAGLITAEMQALFTEAQASAQGACQ